MLSAAKALPLLQLGCLSTSGMGTSSILAGAVLAALLTAAGKTYDTKGLIHAVSNGQIVVVTSFACSLKHLKKT